MSEQVGLEDPGWVGLRPKFINFSPSTWWLGAPRDVPAGMAPIAVLRQFHMSFVVNPLWMVIIVLILCGPGELVGSIDQAIASLGVAAVGVLSLVAVRLVERPLDCSTDETLMASFRQRLFLRIAFASLPVLVGFVGVLLSGEACAVRHRTCLRRDRTRQDSADEAEHRARPGGALRHRMPPLAGFVALSTCTGGSGVGAAAYEVERVPPRCVVVSLALPVP